MKTCFSEGNLMKQFGTPLSTNPPISGQFFMTPFFVQILKTRSPPLILGGRKLWAIVFYKENFTEKTYEVFSIVLF